MLSFFATVFAIVSPVFATNFVNITSLFVITYYKEINIKKSFFVIHQHFLIFFIY